MVVREEEVVVTRMPSVERGWDGNPVNETVPKEESSPPLPPPAPTLTEMPQAHAEEVNCRGL